MSEQLRVTYIRSAIGRNYHQKRTIRALGFRKLHHTRIMKSNEAVWGMLNKVSHLIQIERIQGESDGR